jgi:hypothetical protein
MFNNWRLRTAIRKEIVANVTNNKPYVTIFGFGNSVMRKSLFKVPKATRPIPIKKQIKLRPAISLKAPSAIELNR